VQEDEENAAASTGTANASDEVLAELTDRPQAAEDEIRAHLQKLPDGSVQIEDMRFANEASALDALSASGGAMARDKSLYLSTRLWSRPGQLAETTLPVCFHIGSDASSTQRAHVQSLIRQTWEAVADVKFTGWGSCIGTEAVTVLDLVGTAGGGWSKIGTESLGKSPSMLLNTHPTDQVFEDQTIVHEFGHALGMMHEHWRAEYVTGMCPESDRTIDAGEPSYAGDTHVAVGDFDESSVMYY
jgi:hypothetical protein